MASLKEKLSVAKATPKADCTMMCELISKAFTTRNLLHFAHWSTGSLAAHLAVGDMYDGIIDKLDDIVEVYMGKFGKLDIKSQPAATMPADITEHVKQEMEWLCDNKNAIANSFTPVVNMLDDLEAMYAKTVYKLTNLS